MKSEKLKIGDKLLITQEFIEDNREYNPKTWHIWQLGKIVNVVDISEFSTIKISIGRDVYSTWITNPIAENMRKAYEEKYDSHKS